MNTERLDYKQAIQEEEYGYPYHYIPSWDNGRFSPVQYWSWGFRYLGGMQVVLDQLQGREFGSLVDIGCGDGRFLKEASARLPSTRLLGVDYSERAIGLARALNPSLDFEASDIVERPLGTRFDVATCIETLEHIPPDRVARFCEAIAGCVKPGGLLVLTVPHSNKAVGNKHYQHFESSGLMDLFSPHFRDIGFVPFDTHSRYVLTLLHRLMGGSGGLFLLTSPRLTSWFYRFYTRRYLYAGSEDKCLRIAMVCTKK